MDDVDFDSQVRFDESEKALTFVDGAAIRVGTGSDFSIMHDGTNTTLKGNNSGTGDVRIDSNAFKLRDQANAHSFLAADRSGSHTEIKLYSQNSEKLRTSPGGVVVTGVATATEFVGVFTSAGGAGIGIGSTTAHVGYGVTYIDFKGPGVSTVYALSLIHI